MKKNRRYFLPEEKKTPEQWAASIRTLPEKYQVQVAGVVWWDFLAERLVVNRSAALDEFIRKLPNDMLHISNALLEKLLIQIGYPKEVAHIRVHKTYYKRICK